VVGVFAGGCISGGAIPSPTSAKDMRLVGRRHTATGRVAGGSQ
jgi:hypothetical protein